MTLRQIWTTGGTKNGKNVNLFLHFLSLTLIPTFLLLYIYHNAKVIHKAFLSSMIKNFYFVDIHCRAIWSFFNSKSLCFWSSIRSCFFPRFNMVFPFLMLIFVSAFFRKIKFLEDTDFKLQATKKNIITQTLLNIHNDTSNYAQPWNVVIVKILCFFKVLPSD